MKQLRINDHIKGKSFKYTGRYTWELSEDFQPINHRTLFYFINRDISEYGR